MTASVRFATLDNNTGAVLTPKIAYPLITIEKEGASLVYRRIFRAIDIGTDAGKTKDNTTGANQANNPLGCLLMPVSGAKIKMVTSWRLCRDATIQNRANVQTEVDPIANNLKTLRFHYSADGQSVYVSDSFNAGGVGEIKADDYLIFTLLLSNN